VLSLLINIKTYKYRLLKLHLKLRQDKHLELCDSLIAEESMESLLKITSFIESSFFNKKNQNKLNLGHIEIAKLREVGVSMLGVVYYAMHYLEKIKLCQSCLVKSDIKLRSIDLTRKERVDIEKRTDEIEDLFFRSKDILSGVLYDINIFIPELECFLKESLLDKYFNFHKIIPISNKIADCYLNYIRTDNKKTSLLCLGLKLDQKQLFMGFHNYSTWFGDEKEYLAKLYIDILYFFVLPILLDSGMSKISSHKLSNIFMDVFDFLELDINLLNFKKDLNFVLTLVLRYFMQQQGRGLIVSDVSELSKKAFSSHFSSFDEIISNYCNDRLFDNNILDLDKFCKNISVKKSKLSVKINNLFTKNILFT